MPRKDWTKHVQGPNIRRCLAASVSVSGEDEVCEGLSKGHVKSLLLAPLQTWTFGGDILSALPAAVLVAGLCPPWCFKHGSFNYNYTKASRVGARILVARESGGTDTGFVPASADGVFARSM